ncbi:MAG: LytTR family transcriptional regulator DNA-binding domain-containing protein [Bacteroidales bacterium]|nr:LytTR family transcriptional regulator DNA-binding domain-containing protein [Bacteroidales bacterium]
MDEITITTKAKDEIKLALPVGKIILFLSRQEIIYITSYGNYCKVHTVAKGTLKYLESNLEDYSFYRINRFCLVNVKHLSAYMPHKRKVVLENGEELLVSRRCVCGFREYLKGVVFN